MIKGLSGFKRPPIQQMSLPLNLMREGLYNIIVKHHYNSYRKYLQERFGKPILKIVVNGGFSCPNRDGLKSREGCSFCDNRSFSPVATSAKPV